MKMYERIENNNFEEIDKDRAIELIKNGNGHLVYNQSYFDLQKENEEWQKAYQEEKDKQFELIQNTNNTIKTANIAIKDLQEKLKEVITVQKVKGKIEEYKKMLLSCNRFSDVDRIKAINERILELQELIEGRK